MCWSWSCMHYCWCEKTPYLLPYEAHLFEANWCLAWWLFTEVWWNVSHTKQRHMHNLSPSIWTTALSCWIQYCKNSSLCMPGNWNHQTSFSLSEMPRLQPIWDFAATCGNDASDILWEYFILLFGHFHNKELQVFNISPCSFDQDDFWNYT